MSDEQARRRRSTIADVAALAGVDRAVVSRLLNADPRLSIRDSTRGRVISAIKELDYQPNAAARSLRTSRTQTIALLVPDYANPAYGEIIKGAETAAASAGTSLMTGSMETADESFGRYLERLGHGRVDGLLIAAGGAHGAREDEPGGLRPRGPPYALTRGGPTPRSVRAAHSLPLVRLRHLSSPCHRSKAPSALLRSSVGIGSDRGSLRSA